jgi:hypothetical protein
VLQQAKQAAHKHLCVQRMHGAKAGKQAGGRAGRQAGSSISELWQRVAGTHLGAHPSQVSEAQISQEPRLQAK